MSWSSKSRQTRSGHSFTANRRTSETGQDEREIGDQYTWVAMDRDSKLVLSYIVGKRSALNALALMTDLGVRLAIGPNSQRTDSHPTSEPLRTHSART